MSTNEEQTISESSWTARGEFGMYGRHQIRVYEHVARFERRCDGGWETLVEVHRESRNAKFDVSHLPEAARIHFLDHFNLMREVERAEARRAAGIEDEVEEGLGDELDGETFDQRLERIARESPRRRRRSTSRWSS